MLISAGIVAVLYALAAVFFLRAQFYKGPSKPALWLMVMAFILHVIMLAYEIPSKAGALDFSVLKMMSLTAALLSLLSLIWLWRGYVPMSGTVVCGINSFAVLLPHIFVSSRLFDASLSQGIMLHIMLSLAAFIVISFALLHGLVYYWLYLRLKRKRIMNRSAVALVGVSRLMDTFSAIAFVLLSLSLLTGFIYMDNLFQQDLIHKTVFTVAAWMILAIQLWQRYIRGKQGLTSFWLLLIAFVLLFSGYVVSTFIHEIIHPHSFP